MKKCIDFYNKAKLMLIRHIGLVLFFEVLSEQMGIKMDRCVEQKSSSYIFKLEK